MKLEVNGRWILPVLAAVVFFPIGRWLHAPATETVRAGEDLNLRSGPKRVRNEGLGTGTGALWDWERRVGEAGSGDCARLARLLRDDPRGGDLAYWRHLLARWSVEDGYEMVDWIRKSAPLSSRDKILEMACFAWGASAPDEAMEAAAFLPPRFCRQVMWGMAEVDLQKTVEFVLKMPRQQEAIGEILPMLMGKDPALAETLRKRSVFDHSRKVAERADCSRLAATDPGAAIKLARSHGVIGYDPVPAVVQTIAGRDPNEAARQVDAMPASRTKALSSVRLAKVWAQRDAVAALAWSRTLPEGAVRQQAMLAVISSGDWKGREAFGLIREAGMKRTRDFQGFSDTGTTTPAESRERWDPATVANTVFQRWKAEAPDEAAAFDLNAFLRGEVEP